MIIIANLKRFVIWEKSSVKKCISLAHILTEMLENIFLSNICSYILKALTFFREYVAIHLGSFVNKYHLLWSVVSDFIISP